MDTYILDSIIDSCEEMSNLSSRNLYTEAFDMDKIKAAIYRVYTEAIKYYKKLLLNAMKFISKLRNGRIKKLMEKFAVMRIDVDRIKDMPIIGKVTKKIPDILFDETYMRRLHFYIDRDVNFSSLQFYEDYINFKNNNPDASLQEIRKAVKTACEEKFNFKELDEKVISPAKFINPQNRMIYYGSFRRIVGDYLVACDDINELMRNKLNSIESIDVSSDVDTDYYNAIVVYTNTYRTESYKYFQKVLSFLSWYGNILCGTLEMLVDYLEHYEYQDKEGNQPNGNN